VSENLVLSFTMKPMPASVPGTCTAKGDSAFCCEFQAIFAILEPSGKGFPLPGNAGPVGVDHHGIGKDQIEFVFGLTDGDSLPVFISPELREREPTRHLHAAVSCAARVMPPKAASDATMPITGMFLLFISGPPLVAGC
jgi:hypothetical protein